MIDMEKMIVQICEDCAAKKDLAIPEGHVYSAWTDTCDVCLEYKEVTDIYDYSKIKNENKETNA